VFRKIVEDIMVQVEQRLAEVDGVTRDLAASELCKKLELVLAREVCGVLFRQTKQQQDVCREVICAR